MAPDELDLAGFAVGVVEQGTQLGPDACGPGDAIVGLASPGLRSNGYTLARHVLLERAGLDLGDPAWEGAAHQRGRRAAAPLGDLRPGRAGRACARWARRCTRARTSRAAASWATCPVSCPTGWARCWTGRPGRSRAIFGEIQRLGSVAEDEMDRVFNRGIGMALVLDARLRRRRAARAGRGGAGRRR